MLASRFQILTGRFQLLASGFQAGIIPAACKKDFPLLSTCKQLKSTCKQMELTCKQLPWPMGVKSHGSVNGSQKLKVMTSTPTPIPGVAKHWLQSQVEVYCNIYRGLSGATYDWRTYEFYALTHTKNAHTRTGCTTRTLVTRALYQIPRQNSEKTWFSKIRLKVKFMILVMKYE